MQLPYSRIWHVKHREHRNKHLLKSSMRHHSNSMSLCTVTILLLSNDIHVGPQRLGCGSISAHFTDMKHQQLGKERENISQFPIP